MNDLYVFGVPDHDPWDVGEPIEISVKYRGYIDRQNEFLLQSKKLEEMTLPSDIDYSKIKGLRIEEVEKLSGVRPRTLGQAGRISGVNPSAVQAIMIFLKSKSAGDSFGIKKAGEMDS
jgi:tRNA uridine 5-carboxymethylaminomethyl modification enzyme